MLSNTYIYTLNLRFPRVISPTPINARLGQVRTGTYTTFLPLYPLLYSPSHSIVIMTVFPLASLHFSLCPFPRPLPFQPKECTPTISGVFRFYTLLSIIRFWSIFMTNLFPHYHIIFQKVLSYLYRVIWIYYSRLCLEKIG